MNKPKMIMSIFLLTVRQFSDSCRAKKNGPIQPPVPSIQLTVEGDASRPMM